MKILAASDIHGDRNLVDKLVAKAIKENVDLVVLCGDLTQMEQSTDYIVGPFRKAGKRVVMIPGNHESNATVDALAQIYDAINLHGEAIVENDIGIFGCGGANIGLNQLSDIEIYEYLKSGFAKIKNAKKKIMLTHVHPADSTIDKFSLMFPGSQGINWALKAFKPDFLLCGHIHEAEGIEEMIDKTKVINVGKSGKILTL